MSTHHPIRRCFDEIWVNPAASVVSFRFSTKAPLSIPNYDPEIWYQWAFNPYNPYEDFWLPGRYTSGVEWNINLTYIRQGLQADAYKASGVFPGSYQAYP